MMKIIVILLLVLTALVSQCQGRFYCKNNFDCNKRGFCDNTHRCDCIPKYFGEKCEYNNECHRKCPDKQMCVRIGNTKKTRCEEIPCIQYADIAILLDCSGSINKKQFRKMLATVEDFLKNFKIGSNNVQVALVPFNDYIQKPTQLKTYSNKQALINRLRKYADSHTQGGTRTDKVLKYMRTVTFTANNGDRSSAPNIGIIFTDGKSNDVNKTTKEAEKLENTNIFMISIGIGNNVNVDELKRISTNDTVFLTNFAQIGNIIEPLLNATCDYTIMPCYNNPCKHGGECVPYKTGYVCNCKYPYAGKNCDVVCDTTGDMMLVIDESGSISKWNFNKIIDAAMCIVKSADIANGKMRVGVITFAKKVFVHYDLDAFSNKVDLLFVLDLLRHTYKGGPTNTHLALKYLEKVAFTPAHGDRMRYPNYVIIYTDGKSTKPWLTKRFARHLHNSGVSIYAIGIGPRVNKREIFYLASKPKRHHFVLTTFKDLEKVMYKVGMRVCKDLRPWNRCWRCKHDCNCAPGMICCNNCCINQVTVLSEYLLQQCSIPCPTGPRKFWCATSKTCFYPFSICWRGHCRTLRLNGQEEFLQNVKHERCIRCRHVHQCRPGLKCCRGCCVKPKVHKIDDKFVESVKTNFRRNKLYQRKAEKLKRNKRQIIGCVGSKICTLYLKYKSCGEGKKCCPRCKYFNK